MALDPKNQYAFDECSILHFCQLRVPAAWRAVFGDVLQHRNYPKLLRLLHGLQKCFIPPYRFAPASNLEGNLIRTAEGLLEGRAAWMPNPVKKLILEQLQEYLESLDGYSVIEKGTEFSSVKAAFTAHQRPLAKSKLGRYSNIPEDDDCSIIAGFSAFPCQGMKHLITEDEHFWGYEDLISNQWSITIVKEWECDALCA